MVRSNVQQCLTTDVTCPFVKQYKRAHNEEAQDRSRLVDHFFSVLLLSSSFLSCKEKSSLTSSSSQSSSHCCRASFPSSLSSHSTNKYMTLNDRKQDPINSLIHLGRSKVKHAYAEKKNIIQRSVFQRQNQKNFTHSFFAIFDFLTVPIQISQAAIKMALF